LLLAPTTFPHDADDGVELEQLHGDLRIVEVDLLGFQRVDDSGWQRIHVDFQPDGQRNRRADALANHLLHPQHISPQLLAAEGVEPEDRRAVLLWLCAR